MSGPGRGGAVRARRVAPLVVPVLLGAGLCLISLTGRGLGFDEAATVAIASQHGAALGRGIAHDGGNMSGYYLLVHVLIGAFGDGPWVLRLPSVVFAALTPGLVAAIAIALWGDRRAAWIAGVLAAVSVPLVYWGQTARGYAAMVCLACVGMLCFVRAVEAYERGQPLRRWLVGYVIAMTLAAYCGFIVVLVVVPQALSLLGRPRALIARCATAAVGLAVLCIPIAVLAVRRGSGQLFWVSRPGGQIDEQVLQSLTSAGFQSTFHRAVTTTPGWILLSAVLIAIIVVVIRTRLGGWGMALALLWALAPALVEFVGSYVSQPVFLPRNVLVSVPAVALVLGGVLADRRLPRWAALGGVALALLLRAVPVAAGYTASPEPWRAVTERVLADSRPGDCVTFYPEDSRNPFRYYVVRDGALRSAPRSVLPDVGWASTRPYVERYPTLSPARIATLRHRCTRMWLISGHVGQTQGPPEARRHLARWLRLRGRLQRAFGRGPTRTDGVSAAIRFAVFGPPGR